LYEGVIGITVHVPRVGHLPYQEMEPGIERAEVLRRLELRIGLTIVALLEEGFGEQLVALEIRWFEVQNGGCVILGGAVLSGPETYRREPEVGGSEVWLQVDRALIEMLCLCQLSLHFEGSTEAVQDLVIVVCILERLPEFDFRFGPTFEVQEGESDIVSRFRVGGTILQRFTPVPDCGIVFLAIGRSDTEVVILEGLVGTPRKGERNRIPLLHLYNSRERSTTENGIGTYLEKCMVVDRVSCITNNNYEIIA
jgi:hypothetical protein